MVSVLVLVFPLKIWMLSQGLVVLALVLVSDVIRLGYTGTRSWGLCQVPFPPSLKLSFHLRCDVRCDSNFKLLIKLCFLDLSQQFVQIVRAFVCYAVLEFGQIGLFYFH